MARKSVLIIDDEEHGRVLVKQYLKPYTDYFIAGECVNGIEAIQQINRLEPDLIFLDIQMPGANGFEVLQQIEHVPEVIFTTAYDKYAIQAFETNATDYLLKPYTGARFEKTIAKLGQQSRQLPFTVANSYSKSVAFPERLLVEHKKRFRNIAVADILFLQAFGDYTEIHTKEITFLNSTGISALSAKLDPAIFIRIHRSVAVNVTHIAELYRDIGKTFLVMDNGTEFNVGRSYLPFIKHLII
ncbi:LytTR family DNA-binding domain-containing protein [Ravibacter arvi]|uniref:LytTR family DNA-binding domain-containing protein n=1 Tax=Ravibacter arvi TaxID=2051041 RepID=A0ABP8LXX8_9BACT